jgi:hypothetical protein
MIVRIKEFHKRLSLFADFWLKSGKSNGTLGMKICTTFCPRFYSVTRQMFIGAKNVWIKVAEKHETRVFGFDTLYFFKF